MLKTYISEKLTMSQQVDYLTRCTKYLEECEIDTVGIKSMDIIEMAQRMYFSEFFPDFERRQSQEYDDQMRIYIDMITCECSDHANIDWVDEHESWCYKRYCDRYLYVPNFSDENERLLDKLSENDFIIGGRIN